MSAEWPRIEVRTAAGFNAIFCSSGCYLREEQGRIGVPDRTVFDELETRLGRRALEEGKV